MTLPFTRAAWRPLCSAGRLALLPWPAGAEPARAKGSAYGLVSRAGRSLSPAAAVFVERVLEQDRRFAAA